MDRYTLEHVDEVSVRVNIVKPASRDQTLDLPDRYCQVHRVTTSEESVRKTVYAL